MAVPAVPSQAFGDVQRYLRQKRATGQNVSPRDEKLAWEAYWDSMSSQRHISRELGLRERSLDDENDYRNRLLDLREDEIGRADDAAKIAGITEIAGTAATTGMLLKGTKLGSKIGLGSPSTPGGGTVAAVSPGARSAAPAISALPTGGPGTFGKSTVGSSFNIPMAGRTGAISAVPATSVAPSVGGAGFAIPMATQTGSISTLPATGAAPAGWSAATGAAPAAGTFASATGAAGAAGAAGSFIGGKVAGDKGSVAGGVGAGATAGFMMGGPYAPITGLVGGVVGGLSSIVTGGKESGGERTQEGIRRMEESQIRRSEAKSGDGGLI